MIFLSYKYTNNPNKDALIANLNSLSTVIEELGNSTYILGRDYAKWDHSKLSTYSSLGKMYKNIKNSDKIIFFIDSNHFSKGVIAEILIKFLLNKPGLIVAYDTNIIKNLYEIIGKVIIETDINNLKNNRDFVEFVK